MKGIPTYMYYGMACSIGALATTYDKTFIAATVWTGIATLRCLIEYSVRAVMNVD